MLKNVWSNEATVTNKSIDAEKKVVYIVLYQSWKKYYIFIRKEKKLVVEEKKKQNKWKLRKEEQIDVKLEVGSCKLN